MRDFKNVQTLLEASDPWPANDPATPAGHRPPQAGPGPGLTGKFSLTIAEADVVSALASGLSPAEIAARRGKSVHTVRTQIKQAMAKTATHTQVALVAKLLWDRAREQAAPGPATAGSGTGAAATRPARCSPATPPS